MQHKNFILLGAIIFCVSLVGCKTKSVSDADGNVYKTVTIGSQVWMVENLRTTKYNDGETIQLVTDDNIWSNLCAPAYCWYGNDASNKTKYGALYNWYTVNTGKLCPKGWHVPNDIEWTKLTNYLGGEDIAGGKLKEASTAIWESPNEGATNESGFTALPSGFRYYTVPFSGLGSSGYWWSTSEHPSNPKTHASYRALSSSHNSIFNYYDIFSVKQDGLSVRCLKN